VCTSRQMEGPSFRPGREIAADRGGNPEPTSAGSLHGSAAIRSLHGVTGCRGPADARSCRAECVVPAPMRAARSVKVRSLDAMLFKCGFVEAQNFRYLPGDVLEASQCISIVNGASQSADRLGDLPL
jgi:hypothetical protein